jgi:pyrroline-5-carboxylate reductase
MTASFPIPAWLVGCGNMAGAMVEGWRAGGVSFAGVTVIRPSGTPVEGIRTITGYPANESPRFVMLGFKPQKLDEVAPGLAPHIGPETIVVSMLAGVTAASLRQRFPYARAIFRIMPNLPVAQRAGVTPLHSEDDDPDVRQPVEALMAVLGLAPWCADEGQIGTIGAISASGPAYFARFAEAVGQAGARHGLDPEVAAAIAAQTLVGTGAFAAATGEPMADLARRVASPKGTTEQGLTVLDAPDGLQQLVDRMFDAALRRVDELAREAVQRD